eukprot:4732614-Prymnesium_polylepis.2
MHSRRVYAKFATDSRWVRASWRTARSRQVRASSRRICESSAPSLHAFANRVLRISSRHIRDRFAQVRKGLRRI